VRKPIVFAYYVIAQSKTIVLYRPCENMVEATLMAEKIAHEGFWDGGIFYAPGGIHEVRYLGQKEDEE